MVLGSGPICIGQGIEFDYCSVHSVWAFKEMGYETIIVNNNPETVSTDFDIADKLSLRAFNRGRCRTYRRIRETGRSSCTVWWTDSYQVNRKVK